MSNATAKAESLTAELSAAGLKSVTAFNVPHHGRMSWVETKAYTGWKKFVGKQNGKPKAFYLGRDEETAAAKIERLNRAWQQLSESGALEWTADAIERALKEFRQQRAGRPTNSPDAQPIRQRERRQLHSEIERLVEATKAKAPHRVSYAWLNGWLTRVEAVKIAMPNRPLDEIGAPELQATVDHFESRPKSEHTGASISAETAIDRIKTVREIFDHFDKVGIWVAPRRFADLFRVRKSSLMKPSERRRVGIDYFTVAELSKAYVAANPRQRFLMLLALNTGATQAELASMLRSEFDLKNGLVERARHKTGVASRHLLWAETLALLPANFAPNNAEGLAFLTREGNPLVTFKNGSRVDSVQLTWARIQNNPDAKVDKSFKYLRKTGATFMRGQANGMELAQLYLAHAEDTMAGKHYADRELTKLDEPLRAFRAYIQPMFDAAVEAERNKAEAKQEKKKGQAKGQAAYMRAYRAKRAKGRAAGK